MKRDETIQNYLEAIHILTLKNNRVRAIDVVKYLGFARPTVSIALKQLEEEGYVKMNGNLIGLTKAGKDIACTMYERHELIAQLLIKIGVNEEQAYEDSCLIEHDLSNESFEAIKKAVKKL